MQQHEINLTIEEANRLIAQAEALDRLVQNPDFQLVIQQAYIKEEPVRLASLLGDIGGSYRWCPNNQALSLPPQQFVKMQADIERDIHSVGALQSFFRIVMWRAENAKMALEQLEEVKNNPADEQDEDGFPEA